MCVLEMLNVEKEEFEVPLEELGWVLSEGALRRRALELVLRREGAVALRGQGALALRREVSLRRKGELAKSFVTSTLVLLAQV